MREGKIGREWGGKRVPIFNEGRHAFGDGRSVEGRKKKDSLDKQSDKEFVSAVCLKNHFHLRGLLLWRSDRDRAAGEKGKRGKRVGGSWNADL